MYKYYLSLLGPIPEFLKKYLEVPTLRRLQKIGYFCGMDYASKDIYNFKEHLTRYDHSLSTVLLTYRLTHDKVMSIAALFHDIATPCFSHAIDYMNGDYATQESTEENTTVILESDRQLQNLLKEDGLLLEQIINYKEYSIVDNDRPKVCADRLDGLILTGYAWTQDLSLYDIFLIIDNLKIYNTDSQYEIGFTSSNVAQMVLDVSDNIDQYCHSKEDNYMMQLLANITKLGIKLKLYRYEDLYHFNEEKLITILKSYPNRELQNLIYLFQNIKKEEISEIKLPYIKKRSLNPLVNGQRLI